jgi:predicted nucleic acid-binding protein
MKTVFLDSMLFIYYFEEHPDFSAKIEKIFAAVESGSIRAITSVITLSEILIKPLATENIDLADEYKNCLSSFPHLKVLEINHHVATMAATLKAKYKIKLPDALQLGSAICGGASLFISNDKHLGKIKEIKVISPEQF